MGGNDHVRGATGGRNWQRRARFAQRRPLQSIWKTRFRAWFPRQSRFANRAHWNNSGLHLCECRFSRRDRSRHRRSRRISAQNQRSGRAGGVPVDRAPIVNVLNNQFTPATYNNPDLTKRLVAVWKNVLGADNVEIVDPTMGGEDFSEYSLPDHSIPAVDFHIGAVDPEKIAQFKREGKELPSLHSSKFAPVPEPTIRVGIIGMTSAVLELMKK